MRTCSVCNKRRDDMAMLSLPSVKWQDTAGQPEPIITRYDICVWCHTAAASTRELYPDYDNLTLCPRCKDREILHTQGVCGACMAEIQAYYEMDRP